MKMCAYSCYGGVENLADSTLQEGHDFTRPLGFSTPSPLQDLTRQQACASIQIP